jgi:hypothetical protein
VIKYDAAALERVAQRFRRDMWESVVPEAVTESGVEVARFGRVQATAFGDLPEISLLQQIQGAAEPGAISEGHLADAVEWMRAREVDYRIPISSGRPEAEEAASWLGGRGYERGGGFKKLVRDGSPTDLPVPDGVVVRRLSEDESEGEGLSTIVAEALEMPPTVATLFFSLPQARGWHCYTAALGPDEPPIATGSMMIDGDIAQLGPGMTLEHGRGRGCHAAILRQRLIDASLAGCRTIFVELGECPPALMAGLSQNYFRFGFEEAYESRTWQRPALHPARVY